jgi:hypothetical protein
MQTETDFPAFLLYSTQGKTEFLTLTLEIKILTMDLV